MTKANKAANKETIVAAAAVAQAAPAAVQVIVAPKAEGKADKARAIFNECYAMAQVPQRKDIIARFVNEAGLTKAGAATYLQNFKNKAGLVAHKPKAVAATA